jgi:pimeloyl-ACP methyl ester carboxylesterase
VVPEPPISVELHSGPPRRLREVERTALVFDVGDEGPLDAPTVLLLHGFPQTVECWDGVAGSLVASGFRVLMPAQRGYSPRARPPGRSAYRLDLLSDDALAVLDAAGVGQAHVVGHDWGGAVAWHLAANRAERVTSVTVLSTPHPAAMRGASWRSTQALQSWYIGAFQLPAVPEAVLLAGGGRVLRTALQRSGLPERCSHRYVEAMLEPGALRSALAWYRALRPGTADSIGTVRVPTTYLWSSDDIALTRAAAERTAAHVSGPYRFEVAEGVSHWIPELLPGRVSELVHEQMGQNSAR